MPTTWSQTRKQQQKDGMKDPSGGKDAKPKRVKVAKLPGKKEKPEKPKQVTGKADDKLQGDVFDDPFQPYARGLLATTDPKGPEGKARMPEIPSPMNPYATYLQLPPAKTLGQRDWPKISFGEFAPKPRWRVCPAITDPKEFDQNNTPDLIRKATGKWEVKGVRPTEDPKFDKKTHKPPLSYDSQTGLGALSWTFEEGDQSAWNGLNLDQLREYAFRCLWEMLGTGDYTQQIKDDIRRSYYRDAVKYTDVPVPHMPKPPKEGNFPGLENNVIGKVPPSMTQATPKFANGPYNRDNLSIRLGRADDGLHPYTRSMFKAREQVIQNAPDIPGKYDDTSSDDDSDTRPEGKSVEPGEAQPVSGSDGSSEHSDAMEIDEPEGRAENKTVHDDQGGPSEHRLVGGKAKQPVADDDESAGSVSEGEDMTTIPAHLYDLHNKDPHDATSFYLACKKICNDPKQRQKYFPVANAVRRIRTWAGSPLPQDVEKRVRDQLPPSPAMKRRFGSPKGALGLSAANSEPSHIHKKQCTLSGRVIKSGRSSAGIAHKKK